ncbi:tetratricopeptide repeat protein [Nocardia sp. CA-136227]|uniref:tetratricopeptide repeat protein n=1 Tax=Nocardia sp. CA-136227 TaxID=3239979 RepID=UPI003D965878
MAECDAFISYAHGDRPRVHILAEQLRRRGLVVQLDGWKLRPGERWASSIENMMAASRAVVLVISSACLHSTWQQEEYAALLRQSVASDDRIFPAVIDDIEFPTWLRIRQWIDLRGEGHGETKEQLIDALVAAIKKAGRQRHVGLNAFLHHAVARQNHTVHASFTLTITASRAVLREDFGHREPVESLVHTTHPRVQELAVVARHHPNPALLRDLGIALGEDLLHGDIADGLRHALNEAKRRDAVVRLALEVAEPELSALPWEAMSVEGVSAPLALHPHLQLYRRSIYGPPTIPQLTAAGPLRVLAVTSSPEPSNADTALQLLLDSLAPLRDRAVDVRILNRASLPSIAAALGAEPCHILHISCQTRFGELLLEDEDGGADIVGPNRFADAIAARVSLVMLATRETADPIDTKGFRDGSFANTLLAQGIPAVIAMTGVVSENYAATFASALYRELATTTEPNVLTCFSEARRRVELGRRDLATFSSQVGPPEWARPVLLTRSVPSILFQISESSETNNDLPSPPESFVGRQAEVRELMSVLLEEGAVAVITGPAGMGKTALARNVIGRSGLVPVSPPPGRVSAQAIRDVLPGPELTKPWVLFLDRFEGNLRRSDHAGEIRDAEVRQAIEDALTLHGGRVLVTTQIPVAFSALGGTRAASHPIRALSEAESRLLMWHLPSLRTLTDEEQMYIGRLAGGNPQVLLTLNMMMEREQVPFDHLRSELSDEAPWTLVKPVRRHIELLAIEEFELLLWLSVFRVGPKRAMWENEQEATLRYLVSQGFVTVAGDHEPRHSVHRIVTRTVLQSSRADPSRIRAAHSGAASYWRSNASSESAIMALGEARYHLHQIDDMDEALDVTVELGRLLRRAGKLSDEADLYRTTLSWIADSDPRTAMLAVGLGDALDALELPDEAETNYRRALAVCNSQGDRNTASRIAFRLGLVHQKRGELSTAESWYQSCLALSTEQADRPRNAAAYHQLGILSQIQGMYDTAEEWYRKAVAVAEDDDRRALSNNQIANLTFRRGDYQEATTLYQQALEILQRAGDQHGTAVALQNLGLVAYQLRDFPRARSHFRRALHLAENLGERTLEAACLQSLAFVFADIEDDAHALTYFEQALAIFEEIGDTSEVASVSSEIARMLTRLGRAEDGLPYGLMSLLLAIDLGSHEVGATSGLLAEQRAALGSERFSQILAETLDPDKVAIIASVLD